MTQTPTETTFCSTQEASELLGIASDEVSTQVASGVIESWDSVDGRKLILRQSVLALKGASVVGAHAQPKGRRALHVCLIEADSSARSRYCDELRQADATISLHVFDSVFEALLWIGKYPPHLLILDLETPGVDAFSLLQFLSVQSSLAGLKVVVGTNLTIDQINSRGGLPVGVNLFKKPIPFDDLGVIVQTIYDAIVRADPILTTSGCG